MMTDQAGKLREMIQNRIVRNASASEDSVMETGKRNTRFICVTSGKGGVGKTNFSINLGIVMARMGKETAIIDADLGLANVDVVAGTLPKYTLNNLLYSDMSLEEIIGAGPEGLKIISGGSGLANLVDLPSEKVEVLIQHFQELYRLFDLVILDTGAGLSRNILAFASACDEIIVITTPEPTSLTDAYAMIKAIIRDNASAKIHIVVNRAENSKEGQQYYEKISNASEKFLGCQLEKLGVILEDSSVSKAVKQQSPFIIAYPGSTAAKNIQLIALKLTGEDDLFLKMEPDGEGFVKRLARWFR